MKRIFTSVNSLFLSGLLLGFTGCAFTDYGNRINDERSALQDLERKREDLETRYVMVLNNLERYPGDPRMEKERDRVKQKIQVTNDRIEEARVLFSNSIQEWEQKIQDDKIQQQMIEKEQRDNANKVEGEWNTSP